MTGPDAVLVAGYAAAIPTAMGVLRITWRRNLGLFLVLEGGTAAIVVGWALKGNPVAAWVNAGWGVGFLATWVAVGRVKARRGAQPDR